MKSLNQYTHAYFLGIGGIGMSAICRYFKEIGMTVGGYDKTKTPLTEELRTLGIDIEYEDSTDYFPEWMYNNLENTLFIITPAIPKDHPQKLWLESYELALFKRSEVLGAITKDRICLAIAGTHGKTTTSTLLAHILKELDWEFSAFLGGISSNYGSNYINNNGTQKYANHPLVVVEADEFDRSFHRLYPDAAIITAVDADHLDIYETEEAFSEAFHIFADQIKESNRTNLFLHEALKWPKKTLQSLYGYSDENDYKIVDLKIEDGHYIFGISHGGTICSFKAGLPGYHNVLNASAAIALCHGFLGIPLEALKNPISTFKGVKRRFEYLVKRKNAVVIDDYAHHPEELNMIISSVKDLYPGNMITGIFQPHLFSRTKDFAQQFAASLEKLDKLYLLEIYPAREKPIEGINSNLLLELMTTKKGMVLSKEEVLNELQQDKPEVLLILGAGDIDILRQPIIEIYE